VQALVFPRSGLLTRNGFTLPSSGATSIAIDLKNAQCEWAGQIGAADLVSDNACGISGRGICEGWLGRRELSVRRYVNSVESVDMILRRMGIAVRVPVQRGARRGAQAARADVVQATVDSNGPLLLRVF
jgi:hypothetical protein